MKCNGKFLPDKNISVTKHVYSWSVILLSATALTFLKVYFKDYHTKIQFLPQEVVCLVGWLFGWLVSWLIGWFVHSFVGGLLVRWLVGWLVVGLSVSSYATVNRPCLKIKEKAFGGK